MVAFHLIPIARVNLDQFNGLGREGRRNGDSSLGHTASPGR